MKKLVFDSSSIISLSEKCFMSILGKLAEKKRAEFIMPYSVMKETIQVPIKIRKFELNAIRIKTAIKNKWIKVLKPNRKTTELSQKIMETTKDMFFAKNRPVQLVHAGEIEALALTKTIHGSALVIDERTTRMLLEEPANLLKLFEYRHGKKTRFDQKKLFLLKKIAGNTPIIRSSEIVALGYEKNCFEKELEQSKTSLKAALFSVKYAGCAVTEYEIEEYLKGVKK